ncbi:MAG TPA: ATP-binding cassette domain-containing protein, partial [Spirochaetales bacterium]|nr:ATP-binding cassette domain-containing protein [Spirochaetales bacterium]
MSGARETVLELRDLEVSFRLKGGGVFKAVKGVSFSIYKGETFGLVGESGSGKTSIGRAIVRINDASSGSILYKGREISGRI